MIEGKTKSGFEYQIQEEALNNYELFDAISQVEENPVYIPKTITLLLGKEQKERLMDHVRNKNGYVPMDKMQEEILDIFTAQNKLKN